jgi:hypothetical protein
MLSAVMKKTAVITIIVTIIVMLMVLLELLGANMANGQEENPEQSQPQIMTFEEAIEFASVDNYNRSLIDYYFTGEPTGEFLMDGQGFSGFLIWLAPNGTFYQAEYPSGNALSDIGYAGGGSSWNPPIGYYLWDINYGDGIWKETYWIFANNGTIALYNPPRGTGPTPPPSHAIPEETVFGVVMAVLIIAFATMGLLVYLKKREH